jgi:hypothetical protein
MFTCLIKYVVDPNKLNEFEEYARAWISLIEKYGGTHHGYFMPGTSPDQFPDPSFSFPGLGKAGPDNIAVALFSFPDLETYDSYRKAVAGDPGCEAATKRFNETNCFSSYERNFLKPIFREDIDA